MGARKWQYTIAGLSILGLFFYLVAIGVGLTDAKPKKTRVNEKSIAFTEENIIRGILGEARGEGYVAMYAHACAIRNRQNLKGVFGATAQMEPISADLWHSAARAWHTSEYEKDIVRGATHWLSDYDKRHTRSWRVWISDYQAVARVGTTTFYKRKKK